MHIALGDNACGIGNPRNVHGHLKDIAEADDRLKQHTLCRIEIIIASLSNSIILASALQEMRKARYVSVLADEVISRKTRRKPLLDFLLL